MDDSSERAALDEVLAQLPGAAPLCSYGLYQLPAAVSFLMGVDLGPDRSAVIGAIADRASQIYELLFAPEDRGWLYLVVHSAARGVLPEPLTLDDVTVAGRVDLDAFVPQPLVAPTLDELPVLLGFLPPDAVERCVVGSGSLPLSEDERRAARNDYPDEGDPYLDVLVPVRPRDVDHRGLLEAVAAQDFPLPGRVALHARLIVVDRDRPAVFDMPDDRYCGVAAAGPDRLREVFTSGIAPLNDYRRDMIEPVFGSWPDDDRPARLPVSVHLPGRRPRLGGWWRRTRPGSRG